MGNDWFEFRQFRIDQPENVFRVGTDGVLLGAWAGAPAVSGTGSSGPENVRPKISSIRSVPGTARPITDSVRSILDIGTGTGLIAIMMAQRFPGASVVAIEPDRASFEAAAANVAASKWSRSVEVINSSLQEFAVNSKGKFDMIVTNPPFFTASLKNPDPFKASFRHAGELTPATILEHSRGILAEGGLLSLILPWAEGNVMVAEAATAELFCIRMLKVRSLSGSPFTRLMLEFTSTRVTPSVKILTMGHPSHGGYTRDYIELTRQFYLNL